MTLLRRSRKLAWVVLVVVGVSLALVMFLTSPLWVWFAYDSETIRLVELPLKLTSPGHGFKDHSKPTHGRVARKKRFRFGPGGVFRVDEELRYGCLQGKHHSHNETVALQNPVNMEMISFLCSCEECGQ